MTRARVPAASSEFAEAQFGGGADEEAPDAHRRRRSGCVGGYDKLLLLTLGFRAALATV
jgi:hypothetical protein